jgi:hypothetical protein
MTTNHNLFRCNNCGYDLIQEELKTHQCKHIMDYRIEDEMLWLYDGTIWYPRKLLSRSSPKSEHPEFTPEDGTEPIFTKLYLSGIL